MDQEYMKWYKEARFGMFIHWGLYAIPGGIWKGKKYANEWIMNRAKIPFKEYEKLATQFNPINFSARYIVKLAKDAGMKYLVITAKHHDGFAMFHTKASNYNIVDATPFKRDVILELANECAKEGIRFGVYYSQSQDWHHPDGAGNTWDFVDESKKDFQKYLDELVYPQVEELLTNYGDISVMWFDTPQKINSRQVKELLSLVREKQPECIINSRIGPVGKEKWGDFISLRDNEVPTMPLEEYAETCATLNGGWGYSKYDQNWKKPENITRILSDIVSKNANYLLNIGPDEKGDVPKKSARILRKVGKWLKTNGEAIYKSEPSLFNVNFDWGLVTRKSGKIYCHLTSYNKDYFEIYGIQSVISKAYLLDKPNKELEVSQKPINMHTDVKSTLVKLDTKNDSSFHKVLCLEMDKDTNPLVCSHIMQQPDNSIILESLLAKDKESKKSIAPEIMVRACVSKSLKEGITLTWQFEVFKKGKFLLTCECATGKYTDFGAEHVTDTGHEVQISTLDNTINAVIKEDCRKDTRGNSHWPCIVCKLGEIEINSLGKHTIDMKVNKVVLDIGVGFILRNVKMELI